VLHAARMSDCGEGEDEGNVVESRQQRVRARLVSGPDEVEKVGEIL
jgi:hypothetical protein